MTLFEDILQFLLSDGYCVFYKRSFPYSQCFLKLKNKFVKSISSTLIGLHDNYFYVLSSFLMSFCFPVFIASHFGFLTLPT